MAKHLISTLIFSSLFLLESCQSIELLSIDYLQPADISFPPEIQNVAIVNNMDETDNKPKEQVEEINENGTLISRSTIITKGNGHMTIEAIAEEIANQEYFKSVVICDSSVRKNSSLKTEHILDRNEVKLLASDLGADMIISLENLPIKLTKTVRYLPEFSVYRGAIDAEVFPTIALYLPERTKPMTTLRLQDSIFWENFGITPTEAMPHGISEKEIQSETASFVGNILTKYLVPTWKTEPRFLYTGGSVNMRDANVFVRENEWDNAYKLWKKEYDSAKSEKRKMQLSLNLAVYYEMKDSLNTAERWATTAQEMASRVDKNVGSTNIRPVDIPNYYRISLYLAELKKRNAQLSKLKIQMIRFNDDF